MRSHQINEGQLYFCKTYPFGRWKQRKCIVRIVSVVKVVGQGEVVVVAKDPRIAFDKGTQVAEQAAAIMHGRYKWTNPDVQTVVKSRQIVGPVL